MLSSIIKLSSNWSKDQFRETTKLLSLELFYVQQEGGKEDEFMHVYEDYQYLP